MSPRLPRATRRAALVLQIFSLIGAAVLLGIAVWIGVAPDTLIAYRVSAMGLGPDGFEIGTAAQIGLVAGAWLVLSTVMYTLWHMTRLFACYRNDAALTPGAAHALRHTGIGFLAQAAAGLMATPVEGLLLTLGAPQGQRMLTLALSSADLGFVLAGGMMLIVGLVMSQAVALKAENEGFV